MSESMLDATSSPQNVTLTERQLMDEMAEEIRRLKSDNATLMLEREAVKAQLACECETNGCIYQTVAIGWKVKHDALVAENMEMRKALERALPFVAYLHPRVSDKKGNEDNHMTVATLITVLLEGALR